MIRMRQMDTDKIIPLQVGGDKGVVEFGAYNRAEAEPSSKLFSIHRVEQGEYHEHDSTTP